MKKIKIAVLASGNGSNFQALTEGLRKSSSRAEISLLIVDNKNAFARIRARKLGVKDFFLDPAAFNRPELFDQALLSILKQEKIDLVVLAGYMKVLNPVFITAYPNKIVNIHPAILPAFKGTDAIKRAHLKGCKITGVTVHFVDEKIDHGPIILQGAVKIERGMTLKALEAKIHTLEHKLYLLAIKKIIDGKVRVRKGKVTIRP